MTARASRVVAGTEALLFLVVVPVFAFAMDLLLLRGAYETAQRDLSARGIASSPSRVYVLMGYGAFPVVLGIVLWTLSVPVTNRTDAGSSSALADLQSLIVWTSIAYGVAAIITSLARASVLRTRMAGALGTDFGRILPIAVIPFTASIFALVLGFLVLGYVETALDGGLIPAASSVSTAVSSLQAYSVATLGFLAGAVASNRFQDLSESGYQRALLFAVAGELPAVIGLVAAFLAIQGLYPP